MIEELTKAARTHKEALGRLTFNAFMAGGLPESEQKRIAIKLLLAAKQKKPVTDADLGIYEDYGPLKLN